MTLGPKEDIINTINNSGATLYDLAATYNSKPETIAEELKKLDIPIPSMNIDGPFNVIKQLQRSIIVDFSAQSLLSDPSGGLQHLPLDAFSVRIVNGKPSVYANIKKIYKSVHGENVKDAYTGEVLSEQFVHTVDGDESNFLSTNIEAFSDKTYTQRFDHPIGLSTDLFSFQTKYFDFEIEVCKKYDQIVGGTYATEYLYNLFGTWVSYPLNLYFQQPIEDEVLFTKRTPTAIAWWAWNQLSSYGLLKGLTSIKVTHNSPLVPFVGITSTSSSQQKSLDPNIMKYTAVLRNVDVLHALKIAILRKML